MCLSTCRAYGGSDEDAFPIAVAIEMLHNAFLVHDDVADGSERRRGAVPPFPAAFGDALSLNAGDAMVVLANKLLRRHTRSLDPALADRILDEFDMMAMRTLEGQATELGWRRDGVIGLSPEDYLNLILHKTCWYPPSTRYEWGLSWARVSRHPSRPWCTSASIWERPFRFGMTS